jgi:phosphoribosylglycinamide formyltransferase-1
MARKRIVVFASGRGSNAEAIYEASRNGAVNGDVVMVFSDRSQAAVLRKAASWGVPAFAADPGGFSSRKAYDEALLRAVLPYRPDLICLAGYMRICGAELVQAFPGRIMNIHPALLPSFRGLHAQRQAVEAGVKVAGCTVHFVGTGLDDGPIITQTAVPVFDDDTEESLSERILQEEHPAYVRAVKAFCEDRLRIEGHCVHGLHGKGAGL